MDVQILKDLMNCEHSPSSDQIKEAISDVTRGLKEKNNESSNNLKSDLSNNKFKKSVTDMNRNNSIFEKTELNKPVANTKKKLAKNKTSALNSKEPLTMQQMLSAPKSPIFEVRLRQAEILQVMGNDAYKSGFITDAMQLYERALYHCDFQNVKTSFDFSVDYTNSVYKTCDPLHLNLMRCQIKLGFWRKAITESSKITGLEARKGYSCPLKVLAKAHFLCGKSQMKLRDFYDAIYSLNKSIDYLKQLDNEDNSGVGINIGVDEDVKISINDDEIKSLENLIKEAKNGLNADIKSEKDVWKGSINKKITENKSLEINNSLNDQKNNILPIDEEEINNNNNNINNISLKLSIIETINKFQYKKISKKNKLMALYCVAIFIACIILYLIKYYFTLDITEVSYPTLSNNIKK